MWRQVLSVSIGAMLGALLRWRLGAALNRLLPEMPPGTLTANLVGGYIIGLAIAYFANAPYIAPEWRLLIVTGFCGALTTSSTQMGLRGATLVPAGEGFGQHHRIHSFHFFELADQPQQVVMALTCDETDRLFERLASERIHLFYVRTRVEFGTLSMPAE